MRAALFIGLSVALSGCFTQRPAVKAPDPATALQSIAAADPAKYDRIQDMKQWRNPYLIVRADGVVLFDPDDSAEIVFKPKDVLAELARLPASNWPYGRVVAAAESSTRASEQDGIAIRRNKGIVGGTLESAHIAVRWVSSA